MHNLLHDIHTAHRSLGILIDPEKTSVAHFTSLMERVVAFVATAKKEAAIENVFLLVGGSTMHDVNIDSWMIALRKETDLPVILFPGSHMQLSEHAHGLLFLNLLSGNNADYLIGEQRKAAAQLKNTSLVIIPTAYLLIDGGTVSAVERVSKTTPLAQNDVDTIVNTAYAGQLMGNTLVYLEAGSGAKTSVSIPVIQAVVAHVHIPVIVGGGIKDFATMNSCFEAGARMVVIGTALELGTI